jgi:hypothetical protein
MCHEVKVKIIVCVKTQNTGLVSRVPLTMWLEQITSSEFTVCVAVVNSDPAVPNLQHTAPLSLDYAAFLYTPNFAIRSGEFSFGQFPAGVPSITSVATCQVVLFDREFLSFLFSLVSSILLYADGTVYVLARIPFTYSPPVVIA